MAASDKQREEAYKAGYNNRYYNHTSDTYDDYNRGRIQRDAHQDYADSVGSASGGIMILLSPLFSFLYINIGFIFIGYFVANFLAKLFDSDLYFEYHSIGFYVMLTVIALFFYWGFYFLRGFVTVSHKGRNWRTVFFIVAILIQAILPAVVEIWFGNATILPKKTFSEITSNNLLLLVEGIFFAIALVIVIKLIPLVQINDEDNVPWLSRWIYLEGKKQAYLRDRKTMGDPMDNI